MGRYTKKDAIRIVSLCAKLYKENLANRSLLFICQDKHKHTTAIEVTFDASNYLHLTGLKLRNRKKSKSEANQKEVAQPTPVSRDNTLPEEEISALDFYEKCLNHKLSESDFEFADDGTSELKLDILPSLLTKNLTAKMIGDFHSDKPKLYTEKLAGGTAACMGFTKDDKTGRFVPNTVIKDNIKKHTLSQLRVIACYRKIRSETRYSEITYLAKNVDWDSVVYPTEYAYLNELQFATS